MKMSYERERERETEAAPNRIDRITSATSATCALRLVNRLRDRLSYSGRPTVLWDRAPFVTSSTADRVPRNPSLFTPILLNYLLRSDRSTTSECVIWPVQFQSSSINRALRLKSSRIESQWPISLRGKGSTIRLEAEMITCAALLKGSAGQRYHSTSDSTKHSGDVFGRPQHWSKRNKREKAFLSSELSGWLFFSSRARWKESRLPSHLACC